MKYKYQVIEIDDLKDGDIVDIYRQLKLLQKVV